MLSAASCAGVVIKRGMVEKAAAFDQRIQAPRQNDRCHIIIKDCLFVFSHVNMHKDVEGAEAEAKIW